MHGSMNVKIKNGICLYIFERYILIHMYYVISAAFNRVAVVFCYK